MEVQQTQRSCSELLETEKNQPPHPPRTKHQAWGVLGLNPSCHVGLGDTSGGTGLVPTGVSRQVCRGADVSTVWATLSALLEKLKIWALRSAPLVL